MDCYTKQRCPGCQAGSDSSGRRSASGPEMGMPMGPGPEMGPRMPMGPGPQMGAGMPMGPGPGMRPEMPVRPGYGMGAGMPMGPSGMRPEMPMGSGSGMCPKQPSGSGPAMRWELPSGSIDQYPVAMAYVPWQRWQQTYPLDQALDRGTIFPDLDKPFVMGRC